MRVTDKIKIITTIAATSTAILFLTLYFLFQEYGVLLLSIEVILLPAVYVVGNIFAESTMKEQHKEILEEIFAETKELERKYYNIVAQYEIVRRQNEKSK